MCFDATNYYRFTRKHQAFLNALVLPALSSLTATYNFVVSSYQTQGVNFMQLNFEHLA